MVRKFYEKYFLKGIDIIKLSCYNIIMITKEVFNIKSVIVRISDELHQSFKIKTAKEKTSAQEILEQFIKTYVNNEEILQKEEE